MYSPLHAPFGGRSTNIPRRQSYRSGKIMNGYTTNRNDDCASDIINLPVRVMDVNDINHVFVCFAPFVDALLSILSSKDKAKKKKKNYAILILCPTLFFIVLPTPNDPSVCWIQHVIMERDIHLQLFSLVVMKQNIILGVDQDNS
jgi:uncharacterized Fe-S cluster-containing protein